MPSFNPGISKTARVTISVSKPGISGTVEIYLATTAGGILNKKATSGQIAFVSTGAEQVIAIPVVMPSIVSQYQVYLEIMMGSYSQLYQADEDVTIVEPTIAPLYLVKYTHSYGYNYYEGFTLSESFVNLNPASFSITFDDHYSGEPQRHYYNRLYVGYNSKFTEVHVVAGGVETIHHVSPTLGTLNGVQAYWAKFGSSSRDGEVWSGSLMILPEVVTVVQG